MAGDLDEFANTGWGRGPWLSPREQLGGGPGFADLFSLDAVDELLSRRGLRTPFIRIAKDGVVVASSRYTRPGGAGAQVGDQVADDRVLELFADGHTVVLQALHRTWPPLVDFAGGLTTDLGHPVQVNAYVTPEQSQGFAPHYDVHDVFVLQVAGEKRWRIHEPVRRHPTRDEAWTDRRAEVEERAAEDPVIDTVLRPGDALYLPRGFLHSAQALGGVTCHLTVGVHPVTRQAVLEELVAAVAGSDALRTSLPLGVDLSDPAAVEQDVTATVTALVDVLQSVPTATVAERLATRLLGGNRPAPVPPLAQAAALAALTPDSVLTRRAHLRVLVSVAQERLLLRLADRTVSLPVAAEKAVRALLDGESLRVGDLPGLPVDEALEVGRRLVREAVVTVATATP